MALPGVEVTASTTPPSASAPTDTGVAFLAGLFEKGPVGVALTEADACESLADFVAKCGSRQSYSVAYDWADTYFREGGNRLYPVRIVGNAAVSASRNIAGTGTTLVVTAKSPGDWANGATGGLTVEVANGPSGGTHRVLIVRLNGVEVDRTLEFNDRLNAIDHVSDYVVITLGGGSGLPTVAAAANLTGGTDDRASVTVADLTEALDYCGEDLGPGQVVAAGWTSSTFHLALAAHAATYNRFAVCDAPDTTVKATLATSAAALAGQTNGSHIGLFAPWVNIPGATGSATGRVVPPSALVCARAAVTDAAESANQAPAGIYGTARYATGVTATFSRLPVGGVIDAEDLNDAGVNLVIVRYGAVMVYGNRTQVDPDGAEANWLQLSNARYRMSLIARGRALGEPYVFRRTSSQTIVEFRKDLVGLLLADYGNGDLFGDIGDDRPATAFSVDTDSVNTAETLQDGKLIAAVSVRPTKGAEMVSIQITAMALTEPVA